MSTKANTPSAAAYAAAAWILDCETEAIQAFAQVETGPHGAFLSSGEPVILFERHVFHRETLGRFAGATVPGMPVEHSLLSSKSPGGYGPVSAQHRKLATAAMIDRGAALRSCSWGLFQIMGFNHQRAGFASLQDFINAMYSSVDWHLRAFVFFVRSDPRLTRAIREKDWTLAATLYNGTGFRRAPKPWYDERMATAYADLRRIA